jgi:hypothetical protein
VKSLISLTFVGLLLATNPLLAETVKVDPGQSLQEAADNLQPGDTLLLAEGTYYQSLELNNSGTAEKPITIKAAVPGKVIITGAMENTPKFEQAEGDIYKTRWVPARKWSGSGTRQLWVVADQRNLYNYNSMQEMKTCRYGSGRDTTPLEGFFYQDEQLYLHLLGGADPNKVKVAVSRPDTTILVDIKGQQHVVLEGLRFHVAPDVALRVGVRHPEVSRHVVIRDCEFFGFYRAVVGRNVRVNRPEGPVEFGPDDVTVEHCQFSNYPTYDWAYYSMILEQPAWRAMYNSVLGGNAILPGGNVTAWKITHCYIHDTYDGIGVATTGEKGRNDPALHHEYAYNLLHRCADDNIEFDAIEHAGVRAHHNVIVEGQCLLGLSPVQRGGVTIDHNIVYDSPEYGIPWSVIFKFSTPSANAFWRGGFNPLSGMTISNNTLVNAKSGVSWGTTRRYQPYFKDNTVAGNIIYARDWDFCSGLPWGEGLEIQKNNLCVGPAIEAGRHAPPGVLCSRSKEPFIGNDTYFRDAMPPSLPGLVPDEEIGEEIEIGRAAFAVGAEYVRAAIEECGFDETEYKDLYMSLGAVPPGTKWEFSRPGPRWAVGQSALFRPPLPPSLDPWWVGFAEKPSDAKTVKVKPWRGKFYQKFENSGDGSDPK